MNDPTYKDIVNCIAARRCYNSGQSLARIAKSAKKPKRVIREWLKITGLQRVNETK